MPYRLREMRMQPELCLHSVARVSWPLDDLVSFEFIQNQGILDLKPWKRIFSIWSILEEGLLAMEISCDINMSHCDIN